MKLLEVNTHVIGTDGQDIYYGVIVDQPREKYHIRAPHQENGHFWIYADRTVPLSMFVPDLETLLKRLPAKAVFRSIKDKSPPVPVLFYAPDGPMVGMCKSKVGVVKYARTKMDRSVTYELASPDYLFPMSDVIEHQLLPFMDQLT